jgi:hypothetical protein
VSPILVRPVREQLEHDRLIRHLQLKYKKKAEVVINVGDEQTTAVKIGALTLFPDLVLVDGKKLAGIVEVESSESVNNLEAMAQWVHFSRSRVPFHLYVPVTAYETARRLSEANNAQISEVWTYRPAGDGFDLVRMSTDANAIKQRGPMAVLAVIKPAPKPVPVPEPPPPPPPPPPVKPAPVKVGAGGKAPAPAKPSPAAKPMAKPMAATAPRPVAGKKPAAPVSKARPAAKPAAKPARKPAAKASKAPTARRKAPPTRAKRR